MKLDEAKVRQLITKMNGHSFSQIPPEPPILKCFDLAMDEKTLDFLLFLPNRPLTRDEIEVGYNEFCNDGKWQEMWDGIREMSFFVPLPGGTHYNIATIFPGWIELTVSGPLTQQRRDILNTFMEFWNSMIPMNTPEIRAMYDGKTLAEFDSTPARMTSYISHGKKNIALNQPLTSEHQVRTASEVYDLIAKHRDHLAVMNCFCRQYKQMNDGGECEHGMPLESCMTVGAVADQVVETGIARRVSYEEACELMEQFEAHGCVHTAFHYGHNAEAEQIAICNCCTDCCQLYHAWQEGSLSKIHVKSFYSPKTIDADACTGCNVCGEYCPTLATYYDADKGELVFNYETCVGCGQCVNQCSFNVREMVEDERNVYVKSRERELL